MRKKFRIFYKLFSQPSYTCHYIKTLFPLRPFHQSSADSPLVQFPQVRGRKLGNQLTDTTNRCSGLTHLSFNLVIKPCIWLTFSLFAMVFRSKDQVADWLLKEEVHRRFKKYFPEYARPVGSAKAISLQFINNFSKNLRFYAGRENYAMRPPKRTKITHL